MVLLFWMLIMKNDPHTEHKSEAQKIARRYRCILNDLRQKTTLGDQQAPIDYIRKIGEFDRALLAIGYRTTSETEPGLAGRVVAITPEWQQKEKVKEKKRKQILKDMNAPNLSVEEKTKLLRALCSSLE